MTVNRFTATVEAIAESLVGTFDLRFKREVAEQASPVMRWLDFRLRHVAPMPRTVVASDRFPVRLPAAAATGLHRLVKMFEHGHDVNPYQGRGLRLRNDTSDARRHVRTDLLYADWGILHFHLPNGPIPKVQYFSKPSDWLAFCLVADEQVAFIDVCAHGNRESFSEPALLATALRSWPDFAERYRVNGVSGEDAASASIIHRSREGGLNRFFVHDGAVYAGPGGGVMTSGVPLVVVRTQDRMADLVDQLVTQVSDPDGYYRTYPTVRNVGDPLFELRLHEDGLGLFEACSRTLFRADSAPTSSHRQGLLGLSDLLVPTWCLPQLRAAKASLDALWCEPAPPRSAQSD
ncbi:hypothetical protein [Luteibacter sp. CQ10]|uniref:hypothetical protein n=1 Tax=Luteibacter sp. CQ10 TaxID=2805821 RepID=UPI0034A4088A